MTETRESQFENALAPIFTIPSGITKDLIPEHDLYALSPISTTFLPSI